MTAGSKPADSDAFGAGDVATAHAWGRVKERKFLHADAGAPRRDGQAAGDQGPAVAVGSMPLRPRSSRRSPNVFSMSAIAFDTAGCEIASSAAAFAMRPGAPR